MVSRLINKKWVPFSIVGELSRELIHQHKEPIRVLREIERIDPTLVTCDDDCLSCKSGRDPEEKEILHITPSPDILSDERLIAIIKRNIGKNTPIFRKIELQVRQIQRIANRPESKQPKPRRSKPGHQQRRAQILLMFVEKGKNPISNIEALEICRQVEPAMPDVAIILARMVKKGWLEKEKTAWSVTSTGQAVADAYSRSRS